MMLCNSVNLPCVVVTTSGLGWQLYFSLLGEGPEFRNSPDIYILLLARQRSCWHPLHDQSTLSLHSTLFTWVQLDQLLPDGDTELAVNHSFPSLYNRWMLTYFVWLLSSLQTVAFNSARFTVLNLRWIYWRLPYEVSKQSHNVHIVQHKQLVSCSSSIRIWFQWVWAKNKSLHFCNLSAIRSVTKHLNFLPFFFSSLFQQVTLVSILPLAHLHSSLTVPKLNFRFLWHCHFRLLLPYFPNCLMECFL